MTKRALVLGGGGLLGGTWAVGALCALAEAGVDPNGMDLVVGTSAGSVLAALLGCCVTPGQVLDHYRGQEATAGPLRGVQWDPATAAGGARPSMPKAITPGSPRLFGTALLHPRRRPTTAVLSALLPEGRRGLEPVGALIEAVNPEGGWAPSPGVWVIAMDYATGRRTVFGRAGAPLAPLSQAVMASCAIPGWFAPVHIGTRSFVDGGAVSATSIDVVDHAGMDEVYVIAPTISMHPDQPSSASARLERTWRHQVTRHAQAEARVVEKTGARVFMIGPGRHDLQTMGANLMDAHRLEMVLETSLLTSIQQWQQVLGD